MFNSTCLLKYTAQIKFLKPLYSLKKKVSTFKDPKIYFSSVYFLNCQKSVQNIMPNNVAFNEWFEI